MKKGTRIIAVPGSGKTTRIIDRIRNAVASKEIRPDHTYAIAFTREAAREMKRRAGDPQLRISTIHSLAYRMLYGQDLEESGPDVKACDDFYNRLLRDGIKTLQGGVAGLEIDLLAVDEAQDLSPLQRDFIESLVPYAEDLMVVGDPMQCQPAGTMVRMGDGSLLPIAKLKSGDTVYSYSFGDGHMYHTGKVTAVQERLYTGRMYRICTSGHSSVCTPNHKWFVKWKDNSDTRTRVTYLMKKGNWYRVGHCQLFMAQGNAKYFHPAVRARLEDADALWILKVHSSKSDAFAYEQIVSAKYGIPQVVFKSVHNNRNQTPEMIASIYESVGDLEARASRCLEDHERYDTYPMWVKNTKGNKGAGRIAKIEACNLIPSLMLIPIYDEGSKRPHWESFSILMNQANELPVYSLDVDMYHTYCADGLVTCNSIFSFQGAKPELMQTIGNDRGMDLEQMDRTHRFGKAIATFANDTFKPNPQIMTQEGSGLVTVHRQEPQDILRRIDGCLKRDENTGILFRTNYEISDYVTKSHNGSLINCVMPISRHPAVAMATLIISLGGNVDVDMFGTVARILAQSGWTFQRAIKLVRMVQATGVQIDRAYLTQLFDMSFESNDPSIPPIAPATKRMFNNVMDVLDMFEDFYGHPEMAGELIKTLEETGYNLDMGWQVGDITHEEKERATIARLASRQDQFITIDRGSPVTAMTIHSAKGREFDNVITVVNTRVDINDPEEFRVMYVAATRARKMLDVIVPNVTVNRYKANTVDTILRHIGII